MGLHSHIWRWHSIHGTCIGLHLPPSKHLHKAFNQWCFNVGPASPSVTKSGCIRGGVVLLNPDQFNYNYRGIVTFQVAIMFGLSFVIFSGDHFKFCWVIFIMPDWLEFCVWVFWQPFWIGILDFGLLTAHFGDQKSPNWTFALLNRYIFVCQMEWYSECPVHKLTCLFVDLVLNHCLRR